MPLDDWHSDQLYEVVPLASDQAWTKLEKRFSDGSGLYRPLQRCLQVARANGTRTAVIEFRYIDRDYRSEYSTFYSRTFTSTADTAVRMHFFKSNRITEKNVANLPPQHGYVGYMVLRPSGLGRVGRTMLPPPPEIAGAIRATVTDRPSLFGQTLEVSGVPFVQQDTQLGRCAHAAAWICHYTAHLRGLVSRRTMSEFSELAESALSPGRPIPSQGLTVLQLTGLLAKLDIPPILYDMGQLPSVDPPWGLVPVPNPPPPTDTRIVAIICRYLNSGFPVLIANRNHAFVLVGYERVRLANRKQWIRFYRHDDQRGPYLPVTDIGDDVDTASGYRYSPWEYAIAPLPEKLWLSPEPAETFGGRLLRDFAATVSGQLGIPNQLGDLGAKNGVAFRTYAVASNNFKSGLRGRGFDPALLEDLLVCQFPRYIWVVEAVDRARRARGNRPVLGEAIFDATSSDYDPYLLALHVPGAAFIKRSSTDVALRVCSSRPYASGAVGPV